MPAHKGHKKPTQFRGRHAGQMTPKQRLFIQAYLANPDKKAAALAAGVPEHSASSMGGQWMDPNYFPHVVAAVEKALNEREMRAVKKADDILRYIHTTMFFEPMKYFTASDGEGGWIIDIEGFKNLPPFIGCLIESFEHILQPIKGEDGEVEYKTQVKVRLVSKTKAMELAAKHQLGEKVTNVNTTIPWDELYQRASSEYDPVEEKIKEVKGEIRDGPVYGLKELPKPNGTNGEPKLL